MSLLLIHRTISRNVLHDEGRAGCSFKFPETEQVQCKLRPALVVRKLPGLYDDWLICMISSQLSQLIPEFDEIVDENDEDFKPSGLKTASVIRISRLAVVNASVLLGYVGEIDRKRLVRIQEKLAEWIKGDKFP